jgi:CRISPR/Cas system CMR-associated protein Cmr3 (group 5 of RAMP superfamily)
MLIIDGFKHESSDIKLINSADEVRFCGSHLYYKEEGMKSYLSSSNRVIVR